MKKIISILTVVMLLVCALTGCGGNKEAVATDGSTSMNKVIVALGEAFEADTGITVTYNATGSGAGIQAVQEGRCDIGLSSRDLKDEEKANGLEGTILAYDGIAIIVNPNNPVSDLDIKTIAKIYTGEIKNWKEVGGNDAEIVLIGREAGSGTRDGFEEFVDAVVGGVVPSEETIKDGSYVVQRPFVLVTQKDAKLTESAQKFFDYITSEAANEIISSAGVVPAN